MSKVFRQKRRRTRSLRIGLWIVLLLTVAASIWPLQSQAHSGGAAQLTNEPAGPYRVYAWTLPDPWQAGEAHISIVVTTPAVQESDDSVIVTQGEQVVTDAAITIQFVPINPPGHAIEVAARLGTDLSGIYYEADMQLPAAGEWQTTIHVSGPAGAGSAAFTESVLPPQGIDWVLIGSGAGALLLIVGLIGWWSGKQGEEE